MRGQRCKRVRCAALYLAPRDRGGRGEGAMDFSRAKRPDAGKKRTVLPCDRRDIGPADVRNYVLIKRGRISRDDTAFVMSRDVRAPGNRAKT